MEPLYFELLGSVQVRLGKKLLTGFTTMKARALLIYLAVTQSPHSRDELAGLLWRDMPETQAKKNLRNTLPNLRALVGPYLTITRHTVALNRACPCSSDVESFRADLASRSITDFQVLKNATALYRNDFLSGFYVRDAPAFDDWVMVEREHLRAMAIDGFLALSALCIERNDYELGLATTQHLLTLDPWRETAHQQRMRLLAYTGQRTAALAQYETCCKILADELGVAPMEETTALHEQIKAEPLAPSKPFSHPALAKRPQSTEPETRIDWTEFPKRLPCYGRQNKRHQLQQWLQEGAALVGLFGLGGQGKTTLASEVVWSLATDSSTQKATCEPFEYMIWRSLVNAPPFTTILKGWLTYLTDGQVSQVPDHIDEQLAILFEHLRQHRCLLVLDNFNCLLHSDASISAFRPGYEGYEQFIHQMHRRVHRSSLLLTSREYPNGFDALQHDVTGFRELHLRGLSEDDALQLLKSYGLSGCDTATKTLVEQYAGHPLALKSAAETAQQLFDGDLEAFIMEETLILEEMRHILDQQFAPLPSSAKALLLQLATESAPISLQGLRASQTSPFEHTQLLATLSTLRRRSLLDIEAGTIRLPTVVTAYLMTYMNRSL